MTLDSGSGTGVETQLRRYARLRHVLLGAVALGAGLLAVLSYETGALRGPERQTVDTRFSVRGALPADRAVAIVAVDQKTVRALQLRPPIPRSRYAEVLDILHRAAARLIVVDAQFIGRTDPRDDAALLRAVARDGPVVLATNDTTIGPAPVPAGEPHAEGAIPASAAVDIDPDGVLRRMMYAQITSAEVATKTLAVQAAQLLLGRPVSTSAFPANHAWVDFRGPPRTFATYSLIDVLKGRVSSRLLAGKIVLVGVTDPAEKDVFTTAASSLPMSGVEFQANALETILDGFPLQPVSDATEIAVLFALAAIPALLMLRLSSLFVALGSLGLLVALLAATQLLFDSGTILWVLDPILALLLATLGVVAVDAYAQRRNHQLVFDLQPSRSDFFISYRRADSELAANTLNDRLAKKFGPKRVFMDTDSIDPGEPWPARIEQAIDGCRAMLVVIGPNWSKAEAQPGLRRIEAPEDWVRREIELGLSRDDVAVVPILHDHASLPSRDNLPDSISALAGLQAIELTGRDLDDWIAALSQRIWTGRLRRTRLARDVGAQKIAAP